MKLSVFDPLGRQVRALVKGPLPAGLHQLSWDGRDDAGRAVGSGVYLLRLSAGERSRSGKVLYLK